MKGIFLAQKIENKVIGDLGKGEGAEILAVMIANFLKVSFIVAGLILMTMLLWGAIEWMIAGDDKQILEKARKKITYALAGFFIFLSVFAIINYIAPVLGLDFLDILTITWPTP